MIKFDAIIIGAGQSGPALAGRMNQKGWKVALIERRRFGGTCVNDGCIPTKTLVASARAAYMARRAADFGVVIDGDIQIDMKRVKARKDEIVNGSLQSLDKWITGMEHVTVFHGQARLERPTVVRVGDDLLSSERIFLNVGGRASVPPIAGLDRVSYLTNSSMMDVDFLPEHLIIVGGGYIGLEFGQMYRRFGSEVTILQRAARLLPREDDDVCGTIWEILTGEGLTIHLAASARVVEKRGEKIVVKLDGVEGVDEVVGSHLLLAAGRTPNTEDLGLDAAGVETDARGFIKVDDQLRSNVTGIWAMGDCNGKGAFTHTSWNDYEIVAANLFDHDPSKVSDRILCYGLFVDPPLGRIGMTEKQVRESGRKALVGKRPMTRVGRAKERSETQGFIKIMVDADTREILGAAIVGVNGDEVVHLLLDVMYARAPYTVISRAVHIHPTVAELVPTVLQDLRPLD